MAFEFSQYPTIDDSGSSGSFNWGEQSTGSAPLTTPQPSTQPGQAPGNPMNPIDNILTQASTGIGNVYNAYANLPWVKNFGQVAGNAANVAGNVIGGMVGGGAETVKEASQGQFNPGKIGAVANQTAEATGNFGQQIGQAGAPAGLLAGPGAMLGGSSVEGPAFTFQQIQSGKNQIEQSLTNGKITDPEGFTQGILSVIAGAYMGKGAVDTANNGGEPSILSEFGKTKPVQSLASGLANIVPKIASTAMAIGTGMPEEDYVAGYQNARSNTPANQDFIQASRGNINPSDITKTAVGALGNLVDEGRNIGSQNAARYNAANTPEINSKLAGAYPQLVEDFGKLFGSSSHPEESPYRITDNNKAPQESVDTSKLNPEEKLALTQKLQQGASLNKSSTNVLGQGDFNFSAAKGHVDEFQQAGIQALNNEVNNFTRTSPDAQTVAGLDALSSRLTALAKKYGGVVSSMVAKIQPNLDNNIEAAYPGYKAGNTRYADLVDAKNMVENAYNLPENSSKKSEMLAAQRTLSHALNPNNPTGEEAIQYLQKYLGDKADLRAQLAGMQASTIAGKGLISRLLLLRLVRGLGQFLRNPSQLGEIPFTSPRVAAEAVNLAGRTARIGTNVANTVAGALGNIPSSPSATSIAPIGTAIQQSKK